MSRAAIAVASLLIAIHRRQDAWGNNLRFSELLGLPKKALMKFYTLFETIERFGAQLCGIEATVD